ncbi:MAG: WGR domain-containing protein [Hyphomicrobiales bacterium]|nr:MAG: WGR domain-containing protein [Hyphomicrobiales bacterium]
MTDAPPGLRLAIVDAIVLQRIDPAKNMHRFYRLGIAPDLFGRWCLVAEWGRIGRAGRLRSTVFDDMAQAMEALVRQRRLKERRGYVAR